MLGDPISRCIRALQVVGMSPARKLVANCSLAQRYSRIYDVVAAIPRGVVASYGEVASMAGLPRQARLVGRALARCPRHLPWHRVLSAAGRISLPKGSPSYATQVRRLAAEGVEVRNGRVASGYFRAYSGCLDALLWGPDRLAGSTTRGRRRSPW